MTSPLLPYDLSAGDVSTYTCTCIYMYTHISEIFVMILNIAFILNECLFCCILKVCPKE